MAIFAQPLKKVKFAILPVVLVSLEFRTGDVLRFKPPEVNKIRRRVISSPPNVPPSLAWSSIRFAQAQSPPRLLAVVQETIVIEPSLPVIRTERATTVDFAFSSTDTKSERFRFSVESPSATDGWMLKF